ncbi:hypothetical protein [Eubacterium sp.]|uniref:hypothetical protein n=1 Tax=Eubacterium sp. TaxID=142586 RepID=UPI0025CF8CF1|nr:hypothetical protein [Eubacterium sp.]MCR5630240.1 hypothetical protein [Eubacterium sp.]
MVENKDFTVKYENNINPGKASVIVTGKGMFTGKIKLEFTIEKSAGEEGPTAGSKVKDSKYIYKVIKAGTTDGKVAGEVSVIGLNKKCKKKYAKKIKTAKTNKYKVN